jgi:hypothetical protein
MKALPFEERPLSLFAPGRQPYDKWIVWAANVLGDTVVIDEALAFYRRHGGNVSDLSDEQARSPVRARGEAEREYVALRAEAALDACRELARIAAGSFDPAIRNRLRRAEAYYGAVARWHELRLGLFSDTVGERMASLARLAAARAYGGRVGTGLGLKAMLRDVYACARGW